MNAIESNKLRCNKAALLTRLALRHRITTLSDKLTPAEMRKAGRKKDGMLLSGQDMGTGVWPESALPQDCGFGWF